MRRQFFEWYNGESVFPLCERCKDAREGTMERGYVNRLWRETENTECTDCGAKWLSPHDLEYELGRVWRDIDQIAELLVTQDGRSQKLWALDLLMKAAQKALELEAMREGITA